MKDFVITAEEANELAVEAIINSREFDLRDFKRYMYSKILESARGGMGSVCIQELPDIKKYYPKEWDNLKKDLMKNGFEIKIESYFTFKDTKEDEWIRVIWYKGE